jgi:hypothetical protein
MRSPAASVRSPELGAEKYMNAAVPRVALRWPEEAAASLGVSADTLQRHGVVSDVKLWRLGSIRLVAVDELERLVAGKSERTLRDGAA